MSGLALTEMQFAPAPVSRAALVRQLEGMSVPERSRTLLEEAGLRLHKTGSRPKTSGFRHDTTKDTTGATKAVGAGLRTLVALLAEGDGDAEAYRRAVAHLVGLGPGLTPSGDDLLVAVLATARRLGAGAVLNGSTATRLAAALAEVPAGKTTGVAHEMLAAAAEGRFPAPLAGFVAALGDAGVGFEALAALVQRLTAVGAHSGADWLAGVVALSAACLASKGERCPTS